MQVERTTIPKLFGICTVIPGIICVGISIGPPAGRSFLLPEAGDGGV